MPSVILGICFGTAILWVVSKRESSPSRNSNNMIRKRNINSNTNTLYERNY